LAFDDVDDPFLPMLNFLGLYVIVAKWKSLWLQLSCVWSWPIYGEVSISVPVLDLDEAARKTHKDTDNFLVTVWRTHAKQRN
jgi:hypothetical protein